MVLRYALDTAAADFGRIKAALRKTPLGPVDTLIAAHAGSWALIVVTGNLVNSAECRCWRIGGRGVMIEPGALFFTGCEGKG